jgi:hypothetical protein
MRGFDEFGERNRNDLWLAGLVAAHIHAVRDTHDLPVGDVGSGWHAHPCRSGGDRHRAFADREATDVAETPTPTEEVQPTESTDAVDEPIPTATSIETPTATPAETAATESPAHTSNLQAVGYSRIGIGISQCGNNDRIGEFEFVPIQLALADTSDGCVLLDPSTTAIVTLTPLDGGEPMTLSTADVGDNISFGPEPAGTYTVTITIGEHSATSANLELLPSTPTLMPVL